MTIGWLCTDCWNARAEPANVPCTLAGTPMRDIAWSIAAVAVDSDTPSGRLNEIVDAANCPWWLTASGVFVGPNVLKADSGTSSGADTLPDETAVPGAALPAARVLVVDVTPMAVVAFPVPVGAPTD